VRLSALFLAAYAAGDLSGRLPEDLPEACRKTLPELLDKGFLASLGDSQYRLSPAVRHLAGLLPHPSAPSQASPSPTRAAGAEAFEFSEQSWERWKSAASPALQRHVAAVEACRVCALPTERVAMAFMGQPTPLPYQKGLTTAYAAWKEAHRDRGPEAARFTVAFRKEHGHGPSYNQLCDGLGWTVPRHLRSFIIRRLRANEWLTDTSPVPWTLRPGAAAQGIALPPRAGAPATVATSFSG